MKGKGLPSRLVREVLDAIGSQSYTIPELRIVLGWDQTRTENAVNRAKVRGWLEKDRDGRYQRKKEKAA